MNRLVPSLLLASLLSGCFLLDASHANKDAPAPEQPEVQTFAVELRQKSNSCGPLDAQIAYDTFSVLEFNRTALIYAGTDRTFTTARKDGEKGTRFVGKITEPDVVKKGKKRTLCRRVTEVDLVLYDGRLTGAYTRNNAQDCAARGCQVVFDVTGRKP